MGLNLQELISLSAGKNGKGGALSLPDAFAAMLAQLQRIDQGISQLVTKEPPTRPKGNVYTRYLSSLGTQATIQIHTEMHLVKVVWGVDTTGRGVLTMDNISIPIWSLSYKTDWLDFDDDSPIVVKNGSMGFTPPSGSTNWDVTLFFKNAEGRFENTARS